MGVLALKGFLGKVLCLKRLSKIMLDVKNILGLSFSFEDVFRLMIELLLRPTPATSRLIWDCLPWAYEGDRFRSSDPDALSINIVLYFEKASFSILATRSAGVMECDFRSLRGIGLKEILLFSSYSLPIFKSKVTQVFLAK
jgi:hypothetical protein